MVHHVELKEKKDFNKYKSIITEIALKFKFSRNKNGNNRTGGSYGENKRAISKSGATCRRRYFAKEWSFGAFNEAGRDAYGLEVLNSSYFNFVIN